MIKLLLQSLLVTVAFIGLGCKTTTKDLDTDNAQQSETYKNIPLTKGFMNSESFFKYVHIQYPIQRVIKGTEGCTTLEYIINPQNVLENIEVIASTHKDFSKVSSKSLESWPWHSIPKDSFTKRIKARNTFYYCIYDENPETFCDIEKYKNICPNSDRIDIVSSRVRG